MFINNDMQQIKPKNLSVAQVCEWGNFSRSKFYTMLADGTAPQGFHLGKRRLFNLEVLEKWMADLQAAGAA